MISQKELNYVSFTELGRISSEITQMEVLLILKQKQIFRDDFH